MGLQDLIQSLGDNPYFGAGFGLLGLGAGTAVLRKSFMVRKHLYHSYHVLVKYLLLCVHLIAIILSLQCKNFPC